MHGTLKMSQLDTEIHKIRTTEETIKARKTVRHRFS